MARYGFVVDMRRCTGCNNCAMVCKVENNLPEGVLWNRAMTDGGDSEYTPAGEYPDSLTMRFFTLSCQHCDAPSCVDVCPTGASSKDEETGVVLIDHEACIGCKTCMSACPYEGVRSYNEGEPEYFLDFAVGSANAPAHKAQVVEKCTMCWHSVSKGGRPACADVCRSQARWWGDFDDPESNVSKLIAARDYDQLLTDMGTGPNVYFLK